MAGLAGPTGLADRRAAAAERASGTALPSTDEEVWRYSRIHELDLDRFTPGAVATAVDHDDLGRATVLRGDEAAARLVAVPEHADALGWLHLALAVSTCPYVEVPFDPPAWSAERRDWLLPAPLEIAPDGTIAPPPGPGLGVTPDLDALERYRVG